jgi:hypothetical protein
MPLIPLSGGVFNPSPPVSNRNAYEEVVFFVNWKNCRRWLSRNAIIKVETKPSAGISDPSCGVYRFGQDSRPSLKAR